jgi:hypothetical protein
MYIYTTESFLDGCVIVSQVFCAFRKDVEKRARVGENLEDKVKIALK